MKRINFFIVLSLFMIAASSCKKDTPINSRSINSSTNESNNTINFEKSGSGHHYSGLVHNKVLDDLVNSSY